eukprot:2991992-Pyramimonas_sp.AAC.1
MSHRQASLACRWATACLSTGFPSGLSNRTNGLPPTPWTPFLTSSAAFRRNPGSSGFVGRVL